MRYDDNLRVRGCSKDEPGECWQQVRMQTGFRFVEHHELRWARREKSSRPEKVSQRSIGEFGGGERAKQPMLLQLQLETAVLNLEHKAGCRGMRLRA